MLKISPIPLQKMIALHREVLAHGVDYELGAKPAMDDDPGDFDTSDCSGYVAWLPHKVTGGAFVLTGGSQQMREALEESNAHKVVKYSDIATHMTPTRLFVCFIKPWTNGCQGVGHVWLVCMIDGRVLTIECHGGKGVDSRAWDSHTLATEFFEAFELPTC
jgi:hypothetical protein